MRKKILNARKLIKKSIKQANQINHELLKNQFTRSAVVLSKNYVLFNQLMSFETMKLDREDLIDFKHKINKLILPIMITDKHREIYEKEFNGMTYLTTEKFVNSEYWDNLKGQPTFKLLLDEIPNEKRSDMYFLHRNLSQERRVRKAFRVLIKYTNRELDSKINKNSHLR